MNQTNQIYEKTKKELKSIIESYPVHRQPRWLNKANKDEMIGFIQVYDEVFTSSNEVSE